ncbi:MAG: DNA cytosine methyltransferase [Comamonas sp.]|nr:DNA cytosine methyltransferase [Comamonas sp.]
MLSPQYLLPMHTELVVDLFAGGGGASTGIEQAIGRHVDIAINHSADAIGMHEVNHPQTRHYCADVFEIDPRMATMGQPVGLLHASPDCTHFSQAKGGQPRSKEIRSLAWVVIRWAGTVRPDVITLENVEQMLQWSPLVAKRCPSTGRVVTLDEVTDPATGKATYRVAAPGEVVPRSNQFLIPSKKHMGRNWGHFVQALRDLGYAVQWRVICNADLGAHSTRTRLYMIARCDGLPIVWPEQTHAKKPKAGQARHRPAADCIDWSIQGKSIFDRDKPLAEATQRRIAHGVKKFVLDSPQPFIVPGKTAPVLVQMGHGQGSGATARRSYGANDITGPLGTVTASGGGHGIAAATLVQMGYGERPGQAPRVPGLDKPLGTIVAGGGKHSLTTAFMVQANGGFNATPARAMDTPMSTVTTSGSQQQLCTLQLSQDDEAGALRCAAFLMRYHGNGGQWSDLREPMTTITTRDRLGLVTVWLKGGPWVIVDITLRMLTPRELYNAQDFPPGYVIDRTAAGKPLTKTAQVRMAGNSVSPLPMRLIVAANYTEAALQRKAA